MSPVFFTDRDLGKKFPAILRQAGLTVETHGDHFEPACPDEEWLKVASARGWVSITHNSRIRYTPNERAAVQRYRAALLIVVGKAPYPDLARSFVATAPKILRFLDEHAPPFIAKVSRPSPSEVPGHPDSPGRIELWRS